VKATFALVALFFSSCALFQDAAPKVGNKPLVRVKPTASAGCKLVGTVKGTKLWAGDCVTSEQLRSSVPAAEASESSLSERAGAAIPPGEK
jgi:hypothetical protein